jgi:hypothetical protein
MAKGKIKIKCCETAFLVLSLQGSPHGITTEQCEVVIPVKPQILRCSSFISGPFSPTFPVSPVVYHKGWAGDGAIKGEHEKYGYILALNHNGSSEYGGPLFWSHYSYLGLDPRHLKDIYANYWQENVNQSLINWQWCTRNPDNYAGYSKDCWGLTASYSINGYAAHSPGEGNDLGVISPTAALSSFPYTPQQSLSALKHFYFVLGNKIWGIYGFYDAFSEQKKWYPEKYLAIDQGPVVIMIENYRSGFIWDLFMTSPDFKRSSKTGIRFLKAEDHSSFQKSLLFTT